jgi:hypothetical protein
MPQNTLKSMKKNKGNTRDLPTVTVMSKADPRLKAYQDSLNLYNASINMGKKGAEALAKDYYRMDLEEVKKGNTTKSEADRRYKKNLDFYNKTLVDPITKGTKPKFGGIYKYDKNAADNIVIQEDILNKGIDNYTGDNGTLEKGYYKQTLKSYKDFKKLNKKIKPVNYLGNAELFPIPVYKKPVQPVKYQKLEDMPIESVKKDTLLSLMKKPEIVVKKQNNYEGEDVMLPVPFGGGSSFIGVKKKDGNVEYVKPEDFKRMGVPAYAQEFILKQLAKNEK